MAARARRPAGREDRDACPVCLDPFSTISQLHRKSRYPKLLPCDHCVCEGCANPANDLRTKGLLTSQPPQFFSCPICRGAVDCSATLQDNEAIVGAAPRTGEEDVVAIDGLNVACAAGRGSRNWVGLAECRVSSLLLRACDRLSCSSSSTTRSLQMTSSSAQATVSQLRFAASSRPPRARSTQRAERRTTW